MRQQYTLTKRNGVWYYLAYDHKGRRHKYSTGQTTRSAAHAHCNKLLVAGALIPDRHDNITFGEFSKPFWVWDTCPIVTDKIARGYH
ncbi:MAG: tyrosine-type recombinase/integrase, partial [Sphaerochaetaceae bacterium]